MSYNVFTIPPFDRQLKGWQKNPHRLKQNTPNLIGNLEMNPTQGAVISNNCYKIRVAVKSKGKGKSGGTRVIVHVQVIENKVFLLTIYDKSEQEDITDKEINYLLLFIDWNPWRKPSYPWSLSPSKCSWILVPKFVFRDVQNAITEKCVKNVIYF